MEASYICILSASILLLFVLYFAAIYDVSELEKRINMTNRAVSGDRKYVFSLENRLYKRVEGLEKENKMMKDALRQMGYIIADEGATDEPS